jgi:hypothetical protein
MAKRKYTQDPIIVPEPQVGKRYRRVMDMSDQAYKRLQRDAQSPSLSYWFFAITIATAGVALGLLRIFTLGITLEGVSFLVAGLVLWILIIARMIRDRKKK